MKFFILCNGIFLVRLQGKFENITLGSDRVNSTNGKQSAAA